MAREKLFSVDFDTAGFYGALRIIGKRMPEAAADALNAPAWAIRKKSVKNVERKMIVRTKYTTNGIRVLNQARGNNVDRMFSRVAVINDYLPIHDKGGTIKAANSRIPIPTLQARTSRSIRKKISRRYYMNRMGSLKDDRFFMGKPKGGNRPVGIYERYQSNKRLRMIRNLESRQVKIDATNFWSEPAKRYGTPQFIRSQFIKSANKRMREYTA